MQDVKMKDQIARQENAGHENAGQVQHNTQAVHAEIKI